MIIPTNLSTISLNRGKYPSHYQVYNAIRIVYISLLVYIYNIANAIVFIG